MIYIYLFYSKSNLYWVVKNSKYQFLVLGLISKMPYKININVLNMSTDVKAKVWLTLVLYQYINHKPQALYQKTLFSSCNMQGETHYSAIYAVSYKRRRLFFLLFWKTLKEHRYTLIMSTGKPMSFSLL